MSAVRMPAENVTLLPSGRVMVPPGVLLIGWVTVAIVPAMRTEKDPDLVESAVLVAETVTRYAAGAVAGA